MKKFNVFVSLVILLLVSFLYSCKDDTRKENSAKDFFEKYEGKEGFYSFGLPPALIGIFLDKEEEEQKKLWELLKEMKKIKIFLFDESSTPYKKENILKELEDFLLVNSFENLLVINDGGELVKVKIKESDGIVKEILILVSDNDSLLSLSLIGKMDLNRVAELTKSISIDGLRSLKKAGT